MAKSAECVHLLVAAKAHINAVNAAGVTPLHCAAAERHQDVIDALVHHGAKRDLLVFD